MRKQTQNCTVKATPTVVWDFLADYSNLISLCADSGRATLEAGKPGILGAFYSVNLMWEGEIPTRFRVVLSDATRPDSLEWTSQESAATGAVRFDLTATPKGTKIAVTISLSMPPAIAPLEPFGWGLLSRYGDRFLDSLQAVDLQEASA